MEKSLVFVVITIGAFVSVNSLQCYTCEDCPTTALKDTDLKTCGVVEITTSTAASTAASVDPSTAASTAPSVDPSTAASTAAPVNSSISASTAAPVSPSTAASTAASVSPSTAASTAAPVRPSTAASTAAFEDPGFDGGKSQADGTNYEKNSAHPQVHRIRRNALPEAEMDRGCTCYGTRCACDKEAAILKATQNAEVTYVCAKATVKGLNGTDIIIRGCSQPQIDSKTVCEYLQHQANATNCHTCTTDKCNGAYAIHSSMATLLFLITSVMNKNQFI